MLGDELRKLPAAAGPRAHGETNVRPVEAVHKHLGRLTEQPGLDVRAGGSVRGRCERNGLQRAELVPQRRQGHVFGTEIGALQWASSTANMPTRAPFSSATVSGFASRSGAT